VTLHDAYVKILKAYGNDMNKVIEWFECQRLEFKGKSANDLIRKKQIKKIVDYVEKYF